MTTCIKKGRLHRRTEYSTLRLLAMTMVVFCHIFEWIGGELGENRQLEIFGNFLAVGVHIFLILSGVLYGEKDLFKNKSPGSFIMQNFKKLLLDYYIYVLLIIVPVYFIYNYLNFAAKELFGSLFRVLTFSGTVSGVHHLWFIPYILFCYLITPILYNVRKLAISKRKTLLYLILVMGIMELLNVTFIPFFNAAYINCYIVGFFLPELFPMFRLKKCLGVLIGGLLFCIFTFIWYKMRYVIKPLYINGGGGARHMLNRMENYSWCIDALIISLFVIFCFSQKVSRITNIILNLSDKYSYDFYITHMIFVTGAWTLLSLTRFYILNIIFVLVAAALSSFLLNAISRLIKK